MVMDSSALLSKYLLEKDGNSLKFMQRMLYLIFAEVVYQRELLPREHFTEKHILGCTLHVPNMNMDRRQIALHNHLKGAAEAVEGKKLKQCHLMVHKDKHDPSAADEVFIMDVVYDEDDNEASMQMSCGEQSDVRVCYSGVEDLQKQTIDVFRCLKKSLSTLEPITRNVSFSFYIFYRDGVNRSFHPSGYGQAARMYELPETAEIGDMGMVHAKEHACLLKVKSMLLEDGFQLMQKNAATQRTETRSMSSADPSQMSSDKASSLGVFDEHSEWEDSERGDDRSTRDQRSLGVASARTARFEQSSSILDKSMSEESEQSMELGTATFDDFLTPNPSQPIPSQTSLIIEDRDAMLETNPPSTFASSMSMVTKKLMAAVDGKGEMEEALTGPKETHGIAIASTSSDRSDTSAGAGSEASKETPPRRVSLKKRHSLPTKVAEESTESDEQPATKKKELLPLVPKAKEQSSGRDADSELSDEVVLARKVALERRRLNESIESIDLNDLSFNYARAGSDASKQLHTPPRRVSIGLNSSLESINLLNDTIDLNHSYSEKMPPVPKKQKGQRGRISRTPVESMQKKEKSEMVKELRTPGVSLKKKTQSADGEKTMDEIPMTVEKKIVEPVKEMRTPGSTIKKGRIQE